MPSASTARVLTPTGVGAVAVIEVTISHPDSVLTIFNRFTSTPSRDLSTVSEGRIVFGSWNGEDVVVVRVSLSRWEIHCHGGSMAIHRILNDLSTSGVKTAPQSWIESDCGDGVTETVITQTLLRCQTKKTASLALAQSDGRLQRLLDDSNSNCPDTRNAACRQIEQWKRLASHLITPWRIALVGSPNVGKSSLLNVIAGLQRSIVSHIAGTTRDLVEVEVLIDGWSFRFVDTAGVRETHECSIESIGIEQSLAAMAKCDLICLVVDVTQPEVDELLLARIRDTHATVCLVLNKCDLATDLTLNVADTPTDSLLPFSRFAVSAQTEAGIPALLRWIVTTLIPDEPTIFTALPIPGLRFGAAVSIDRQDDSAVDVV